MSRPKSILGLPTKKDRRTSSGSIPKVNAGESKEEKARYKIETKADPTKAINEAQPSAMPGETTIQPIRSLEHRDADGSVITDPDLSNPTRPRLERPLDTIRSFEAAIDGSYKRRQSFRPESANPMGLQNNRRSGYFNGSNLPHRHTYDGGSSGGFYGGRNNVSQSRPESYVDGNGYIPNPNMNTARRFGPRNTSDPAIYGHTSNQLVYPSHVQQHSHDTVGAASNGSHLTDQWGNSTDPSSENSSVDRVPSNIPKSQQSEISDTYGFSGFGGGPHLQGPIFEEHVRDMPGYGQPGYGYSQSSNSGRPPYQGNNVSPEAATSRPAPTLPQKGPGPPIPIKLGGNVASVAENPISSDKGEKRRSWFNRRFSKN